VCGVSLYVVGVCVCGSFVFMCVGCVCVRVCVCCMCVVFVCLCGVCVCGCVCEGGLCMCVWCVFVCVWCVCNCCVCISLFSVCVYVWCCVLCVFVCGWCMSSTQCGLVSLRAKPPGPKLKQVVCRFHPKFKKIFSDTKISKSTLGQKPRTETQNLFLYSLVGGWRAKSE